jgi:uncharacterized protein
VALQPQQLLLVGLSARMMAQSARRGGWQSVVLDLFDDRDTCEAAQKVVKILPGDHGFDEASLLSAARRSFPVDSEAGLIVGSGFDASPGLLKELSRNFVLFGNDPATVRSLKQPERFFQLLQQLDIAYPESSFGSGDRGQGWLVKRAFSEGGAGIRYADRRKPLGPGEFLQRRVSGPTMSVLFLADGEKAQVIGFNTQWSTGHDPARPFQFAGIVNAVALRPVQRRQVAGYVSRLTAAAGLKGLNSVDFMCAGEQCLVLEVNPRPGASMGLYDAAYPAGLIAEHLRSCQGELNHKAPRETAIRAYKIVYAAADLVVPNGFSWPEWSHDRPFGGTRIAARDPLCSVTASGSSIRQTLSLLERRGKTVLDRLFEFGCSAAGQKF